MPLRAEIHWKSFLRILGVCRLWNKTWKIRVIGVIRCWKDNQCNHCNLWASPPPYLTVLKSEDTFLPTSCQVMEDVECVWGNTSECHAVRGGYLFTHRVRTVLVVIVQTIAVTCGDVVVVVPRQIPYFCYRDRWTEVKGQGAVIRLLRLIVRQRITVNDAASFETCVLVAVGDST